MDPNNHQRRHPPAAGAEAAPVVSADNSPPEPQRGAAWSPAAAAAAAAEVDWRSSVGQSYRNRQVREISDVLASLEPGTTPTMKLRLAMQFEDAMFKASGSMADYQKRISKRLKKLKKSYVPPGAGAAGAAEGALQRQQSPEAVRQAVAAARKKYGEALLYIYRNAPAAVERLRATQGEEKAAQLKVYTDSVKGWLSDLGMTVPPPQQQQQQQQSEGDTGKPAPAAPIASMEQLEKLKELLDRRVDNLRSHVVRHADPDLFVSEALAKAERSLSPKGSEALAKFTKRRYDQLENYRRGKEESASDAAGAAQGGADDANAMYNAAWEGMHRSVPPPTRRSQQHEREQYEKNAALVQLGKMRSAATLMLAWMMVADKKTLSKKLQQQHQEDSTTLQKAHAVATEGMEFVSKVMKEMRRREKGDDETDETVLRLEDAWMKSLEAPPRPVLDELSQQQQGEDGSNKRPKLRIRPYVRTQILLTPGRKPPPNLLPALKRKRAILKRPPPNGEGTHLVLEFGHAFVMTIFFSPLLVTIRAYNANRYQRMAMRENNDDDDDDDGLLDMMDSSSVTFPPLSDGLTKYDADEDGDGGGGAVGRSEPELTVWGATGTYSDPSGLGRVAEERLRDAGVGATRALRRIFENAKIPTKASPFETEIREATALLEFVQLARVTYVPDWQDDDT